MSPDGIRTRDCYNPDSVGPHDDCHYVKKVVQTNGRVGKLIPKDELLCQLSYRS